MKSKAFAALLFMVIGFLLVSCATQSFIPKGSKDHGAYFGRFSGELALANGEMRLHFFQTPEGEVRFRGIFESEARRGQGQFVRGTVQDGKTLEGEFEAPATGTIKGQLSEDRSHITGTFDSDMFKDGTWQVDLRK